MLLVASACDVLADDDDDSDLASRDTRGWGDTPGVRAIAGFSGQMFGGHGRPLAVGVIGGSVTVGIAATAPDIGGLRSSDPSIFEVASGYPSGRSITTTLMSHHSGNADLILFDQAGAEIDRTPVSVADSTTLVLDEEWRDAMPTILAGSAVPFHVTPFGRDRAGCDVALLGTGSVAFQVTGTITQEPMSLGGDDTLLLGALGDGTVKATSPTTSVDVPIHVVDATALTAIEAPDTIIMSAPEIDFTVTLRAGSSVRVLGAYCVWQTPPGIWIDSISGLRYRIRGDTVRTTTITCMAPNGLSKTITLTSH